MARPSRQDLGTEAIPYRRIQEAVLGSLDLRGPKRDARSMVLLEDTDTPPSHQPYEVARIWGWPSASRFCRANWSLLQTRPNPRRLPRAVDRRRSILQPSSKTSFAAPGRWAEGFSQSRTQPCQATGTHPALRVGHRRLTPRPNGGVVFDSRRTGTSCPIARIET